MAKNQKTPTIPKSVRVGPYDWKIVHWDNERSTSQHQFGECRFRQLEICVCVDDSLQHVGSTLLHEVMHACYRSEALDDKDNEERTVDGLSMALCQVMRDNPDLFTFLDHCFKSVEKPDD